MSRWIVLLVIGCGGGSRPASQSAQPMHPALVEPAARSSKTLDCKQVAEHVVELVSASFDQLVTLYIQRCEQDTWTADARTCLADAGSRKDSDRCFADHLTNAQRKALGEAALAAFGDPKQ